MNNLIPYFIEQKYLKREYSGDFKAFTMFIDIQGFTALTENLMKHGREGAEVLNKILNNIFEFLIDAVYQRGGFITTFAGDAFTAVFPVEKNKDKPEIIFQRGISSAFSIRRIFEEKGIQSTRFGAFELFVKIGLSFGEVRWGIVGFENHRTYFFRGKAIDGCALAENKSRDMQIILNENLFKQIENQIEIQKIENEYYQLTGIKFNEIEETESEISQISEEVAGVFLPKEVVKYRLEGELRDVVSVFLSFKEPLEFRELSTITSSFLKKADAFGGYFDSLDFGDKGSKCLVIFGIPVAYENIIERAVNFIESVKEEFGENIRAGISFGPVFCGIKGSRRRAIYSVLGDIVNLSARMMKEVKWGQILITNEIGKVISKAYEIKDLGDHKFKGKSKSVQIFELLNKKRQTRRELYEGDIIGRTKEIKYLTRMLKPVKNGKFGGVVYIYGDPGIGKSRLIYEFTDSLKTEFEILTLQTDNIIKKSLNLFIYFFSRYFEQSEANTLEEKKNIFEEKYKNLLSSLASTNIIPQEQKRIENELLRIKSIIGSLIGLYWKDSLYEKIEKRDRPGVIRLAIKEFIKALSQINPVILLVEDLHWIDRDSQEVFKILTRNIEDYQILILITSRFEDDGSKLRLKVDDEVKQNEIILENIEDNYIKVFIEKKLIKAVNSDLLCFIKQKTEGNPFYLEQFCLYIKELNLVEEENGILKLKKKTLEIPSDINTILIARIDRLSSELKEAVQVASVLGREFAVEILHNLIDLIISITPDNRTLLKPEKFDGLLGSGEKEKIWSSVTEIKYIFSHALLRDVVYEMQLRERLRNLHKLAGEVIEKIYNDDRSYYSDIAYHFEKAEIFDKAVEYYKKAADFVEESYKIESAIEYYKKILSMSKKNKGKNGMDLVESYNKIGKLHAFKARYKDAMEYYNKTLEIIKISDGDNRLATAEYYKQIGSIYEKTGKFDKALEYLNKALDIQRNLLDAEHRDLLRTYFLIGLVHMDWYKGDLDKALENFNKVLNIIEKKQGKDFSFISNLYNNIGVVYWKKIDLEKAEEYFNKALTLQKKKLGERHTLTASSLNNTGFIYAERGEYDKAYKNFDKARIIFEYIYGFKHPMTANSYGNIGILYHRQGKYKKAIEFLKKTIDIDIDVLGENHQLTNNAVYQIGEAYVSDRNYKKAIEYFERSLNISKYLGNVVKIGKNYSILSYLYYKKSDIDKALKHALLYLRNFEETGINTDLGMTYLVIALILCYAEDFTNSMELTYMKISELTKLSKKPAEYFKSSLKISSEVDNIFNLTFVLYEYGKYLYLNNEKEKGLEKIKAAKEKAIKNNLLDEIENIKDLYTELNINN